MDKNKIEELKVLMEVSGLIERCQTLGLITALDRAGYFSSINDKAHAVIESLLS